MTTKIETYRDSTIGNTNIVESNHKDEHKKQCNQLKKWFFTMNNYNNSDIDTLKSKFDEICEKYVFQEELGANGTKHLQGSIVLNKKMRWSEFKLPNSIHWEKTNNETASFDYCCKNETRNGEIYTKNYDPIKYIPIENFFFGKKIYIIYYLKNLMIELYIGFMKIKEILVKVHL